MGDSQGDSGAPTPIGGAAARRQIDSHIPSGIVNDLIGYSNGKVGNTTSMTPIITKSNFGAVLDSNNTSSQNHNMLIASGKTMLPINNDRN